MKALFIAAVFLSATLLFMVQPLVAKILLPVLGQPGRLEHLPGVLSGRAASRVSLRSRPEHRGIAAVAAGSPHRRARGRGIHAADPDRRGRAGQRRSPPLARSRACRIHRHTAHRTLRDVSAPAAVVLAQPSCGRAPSTRRGDNRPAPTPAATTLKSDLRSIMPPLSW